MTLQTFSICWVIPSKHNCGGRQTHLADEETEAQHKHIGLQSALLILVFSIRSSACLTTSFMSLGLLLPKSCGSLFHLGGLCLHSCLLVASLALQTGNTYESTSYTKSHKGAVLSVYMCIRVYVCDNYVCFCLVSHFLFIPFSKISPALQPPWLDGSLPLCPHTDYMP